MIRRTKWVERVFDFSLPVGVFPCVAERLRGTPARLEGWDEERLGRVSRHPRLDRPMRAVDMAYFVAEHDDHHLAKMTELARRSGRSTIL